MSNKCLVLGASGMLGHAVMLYLGENKDFDVYGIARRRKIDQNTTLMDVQRLEDLDRYLEQNIFDVVINCIGVLNINAEKQKDNAVFLNSFLPHYLEYRYSSSKTRVIHISTDCVFSGKRGGYCETDFSDGAGFYDRTKALGEIINDKDLTFRMSIIGPDPNPDGIGLFNWFMKSHGGIDGYSNVFWTGVTNIELARAIEAAVYSGLTGLYHLVPDNPISKFELLNLFKTVFCRDSITVREYDRIRINKSLVNTRKDFDFKVPGYIDMVSGMKEWIEKYKVLYPHY